MRIRLSVIPLAALASLPASQWVMVQGCSASESTEPRLTANLNRRRPSRNRYAFLLAADGLERDHAAGAEALPLEEIVTGMAGGEVSEIVDGLHLGVVAEEVGNPPGVVGLTLHAEFQRRHAAEEEPRGEWGHHVAGKGPHPRIGASMSRIRARLQR